MSPLDKHQDFDSITERLAARVMDSCFEVHRVLGPGFLESVYEQALAVELDGRRIPYRRQVIVGMDYKGRQVGECRLDYLIDDRIVLELKAIEALVPIHRAQVIPYLKTTRCRLGLLVNFNVTYLKDGFRRVILSDGSSRRRVVAVNPP